MDKKLVKLVNRLKRIFPYLEFSDSGHYLDGYENDFIAPVDIDWYDIIDILNKNGLEIKNKQ